MQVTSGKHTFDPVEALERAKAFLRERGHAKHTLQGENGAVCAFSSLAHGVTGRTEFCGDYNSWEDNEAVNFLFGSNEVCAFNNRELTGIDDVITHFDRRIEHFKAQGA